MENGVDTGGRPDSRKPAVVKKYANRRLYNTATSSYVTLDELSAMVRNSEEFVVYDAKSGDDITRSVLTQIILEEDSKGRNLLPIGFLRQLISYYDDNLHAVLPRYLEVSMENFARHQDQMREYMGNAFRPFLSVVGWRSGSDFRRDGQTEHGILPAGGKDVLAISPHNRRDRCAGNRQDRNGEIADRCRKSEIAT